jgi:DNA invertase Pin-like site-specific DNA recombinase
VKFGRPTKLSPHQRREALARLNAGEPVAEIARTFGIDRATVYRLTP